MNEVNYAEKVIIPALQKRAQELLNNNLVLEISLLVEQEKNRNMDVVLKEVQSSFSVCNGQLESEVTRATSFAHEANQLRSEVSTMTARVTAIETDLRRETSLKESVLSEYKTLKQSCDSIAAELETAKARILELQTPQVVDVPSKKVSKTVANG